jgi:hypothetical protein
MNHFDNWWDSFDGTSALRMASTYTGQHNTEIHAVSGIRTHDLRNKEAYASDSATTGTGLQLFHCKKSKAVPLDAMEALGGRGGIAPTHSRPRH